MYVESASFIYVYQYRPTNLLINSDGLTPGDNTVTSAKIVNRTIVSADLADDAVTTDKIVDGSVTSAKLAAGAGGAFNNFTVKTANYTAVAGDQIIVNSSSATTITLPASPSACNSVFIKATGGGTVTVNLPAGTAGATNGAT